MSTIPTLNERDIRSFAGEQNPLPNPFDTLNALCYHTCEVVYIRH